MSVRRLTNDIAKFWAALRQAAADAEFWHSQCIEQTRATYVQWLADTNKELEQTIDEAAALHRQATSQAQQQFELQSVSAATQFSSSVTAAQNTVDDARLHLGILGAGWDDDRWLTFNPALQEDVGTNQPAGGNGMSGASDGHRNLVPGGVRVGVVQQPGLDRPIDNAPALVPLIGKGHFIVTSRGAAKAEALLLLQSVVTRIAATFPALSARFVFIDPLGLGDNFPFKALPESIRGDTVYSEPDEIRANMRELTEHLRRVTLKYLARDFDNIEAYNQEAKEIVEAYRFLCVTDFPAKFDQDSAMRLLSVAEKGVRTGVYLLMHINLDADIPRDFDVKALMHTATVLSAETGKFSLPLQDGSGKHTSYFFTPDSVPSSSLFNELMTKVGEQAALGSFRGIPFERIAPPQDQWWDSAHTKPELIEVPIGRAGARDLLNFWLGKQSDGRISSHALVGGKTGSGKSTLFHVLINSLALTYSPDELEMYLVDFKEGVEFKPYADAQLPHARVIAIESEREFGLSILRRLQTELELRGVLLKEADVRDLTTYRERTGKRLPRVLLIMDEFQMLFADRDNISTKAGQILDDLARRGRAFGIHLVLGSQSVRVADIPRSTFGQFATRIVLQSPEEEIAELLGQDSTAAADLLERPGEVIYNDDGGRKDRNTSGQVAILSEEAIPYYLELIRELAIVHRDKISQLPPPIVFRGNEASSLDDNQQLQQLFNLSDWPSVREMKEMFDLREWVSAEDPGLAWLGEALEIKPHTAVPFRRRGRSNLLLVGDSEETIFGMIGATLISLAGCYRPEDAKFRIIDLSLKDEDWEDTAEDFAEHFDFYDVAVRERRGATALIDEVAEVVRTRQARYEQGEDNLGPSIFLIVGGLHRLPELRPVPGKFGGDEPSDYARMLIDIVQRGPELGVYTILWCDSPRSFESALGRPTLAHFDRRVALSMSEDDSQGLLGETSAAKLQRHRALLRDDEQSIALEKFKPYALPARREERNEVIRRYAHRLRLRLGNIHDQPIDLRDLLSPN